MTQSDAFPCLGRTIYKYYGGKNDISSTCTVRCVFSDSGLGTQEKEKDRRTLFRKAVIKFVLFGALGVILFFCLTLVLPVQEDTFYGMNPIISGCDRIPSV